jgi:hypothetical protein
MRRGMRRKEKHFFSHSVGKGDCTDYLCTPKSRRGLRQSGDGGTKAGRAAVRKGERLSRESIGAGEKIGSSKLLKQAIGIYGLLTGSVSRLTVAGWPREGREEIGQNVL